MQVLTLKKQKFMEQKKLPAVKVEKLEIVAKPMPKNLLRYEDRPLNVYNILVSYKCPMRKRKVHRLISLKTHCYCTAGGLYVVYGSVELKDFERMHLKHHFDYISKEKIISTELAQLFREAIVGEYIPDKYLLKKDVYGTISNSIFQCCCQTVPMIWGYNNKGTLDRVSVNMDLFKPAKKASKTVTNFP